MDDAGNRTQRLKELECDSGSRLSGSRHYVAVSAVVRQIDADYEAYLSNLSGSGVRSSGWKLVREIRNGSIDVEGCVTHSHCHPCAVAKPQIKHENKAKQVGKRPVPYRKIMTSRSPTFSVALLLGLAY